MSDNSLTTGQSFTLRATVRNEGAGRSQRTTLRYYRSSNSNIASSDTEVGTDAVGELAASGTSAESIRLNAPSSPGTHYYGACVDSVSDESDTSNNCSAGVRVTVSSGGVVPSHPTNRRLRLSPPGPYRHGQRITVILSWDSVPGATSYKVFFDDDTNRIFFDRNRAGACTVTSRHDHTDTTISTSYRYLYTFLRAATISAWVQACNSSGCSCFPTSFDGAQSAVISLDGVDDQ